MSDGHDDQGFSHHCPKCNHHNPTMCVMAGQVTGLKKVAQNLKDEIARAWAALKVDPKEAADDPDTADLADSIRVSLQYERDRVDMAVERALADKAREQTATLLDHAKRGDTDTSKMLADRARKMEEAYERTRVLERALCAAREHDPSCPVKPTGPYDPLVHVDGCTCGAAKTNARIDAALDTQRLG